MALAYRATVYNQHNVLYNSYFTVNPRF